LGGAQRRPTKDMKNFVLHPESHESYFWFCIFHQNNHTIPGRPGTPPHCMKNLLPPVFLAAAGLALGRGCANNAAFRRPALRAVIR